MDSCLLTIRDVQEMLKVSRTMVYKMIHTRTLPAPLRLSNRVIRWRSEDIERFLEEKSKETN